jgi:hypothetical protein
VTAIDTQRAQLTARFDRHDPVSGQPITRSVAVSDWGTNLTQLEQLSVAKWEF